jgi:hypothetical protein
MSETHECAMGRVRLCEQRIPLHRWMCRPHWFQVPKEIRARVWETWGGGSGVLDPAYHEAVKDAVAAVKAKLELAS